MCRDLAPTGHGIPAQGNALGSIRLRIEAFLQNAIFNDTLTQGDARFQRACPGLVCGRRVGARMRSPRWGLNAVAALGRECGRPVGLQNIQGTVLFGIADYVWYQRLFGAMGLRYGLVAGGWSCAVNGEGNRWWRLVEHRWCWVGFGYDSRRAFIHLAELYGSRGDLSLLGFLHFS